MGALRRRSAGILAVVALATACTRTTPEATPSSAPDMASPTAPAAEPGGLRVAVVLPASGAQPIGAAGLRAAAGDLRADSGDEIGELRLVAPDAAEFVADIVDLLADEAYDLVCAIGDAAEEAVLAVAADHPDVRFCAAPSTSQEPAPPNVDLVVWRMDEVAYVAGAAAAEGIAPPVGIEEPTPQPGLVGDPAVVAIDRQAPAFVAGMERRVSAPIQLTLGVPTADEESTAQQTRFILEAGGQVVFGAAGASFEGLLRGAAEAGGLAVTLLDVEARVEDPPTALLAVVQFDAGLTLERIVRAVLDGTPPATTSLGVAEGALSIVAGGAPRSPQAVAAGMLAIDDLAAGRIALP